MVDRNITQYPRGDQESLIIASVHSGQMQAREFNEPVEVSTDPNVDVIERDIHLQNLISLINAVHRRTGLAAAAHTSRHEQLEESYGDDLQTVLTGAERKKGYFQRQARWEFARAFGLFALVDSGMEAEEARASVREDFVDFIQRFGDVHKTSQRNRLRDDLADNIRIMQDEVTHRRRAKAQLAPKPQPPAPEELEETAELEDQLDTPARLRAISEDPRAGFLPTTNREKNQVIAYLDYLDNPDYPLGVSNQLMEIFNSHQRSGRPGRVAVGQQTLISITYELGDYLQNAVAQLRSLRALEVLVSDCPNPKVTLGDEIGKSHLGFGSLVRYMDILALRNNESTGAPFDPLRTREDRRLHSEPDKHKTIEDRYTARHPNPKMITYVTARASAVTIGEARQLVSATITDQERRQSYWQQRLVEIGNIGALKQAGITARRVSQIIHDELLPLVR